MSGNRVMSLPMSAGQPPVLGEQFVVGIGSSQAGRVVGEGVNPHVHADVLVVARYGTPQSKGGTEMDGSLSPDEGDQLVTAGFRGRVASLA